MKLKHKVLFLIFNYSLLISLSSCYTWWESKIPFNSDDEQISLPEFFYREKAATVLETPDQLFVTKGLYSNSIKLRWSEVRNASSYRIERAVSKPDANGVYAIPEDSDFKLLSQYNFKTTYEDVILRSTDDGIVDNSGSEDSSNAALAKEYSYRYYYRISAENIGRGLESSPFTDISVFDTEGLGWLLPPPKGLIVGKGKDPQNISLEWEPVANAKLYRIYKGTTATNCNQLLAKVRANKTSYSDNIAESDQGKDFYYRICAEMDSGNISAYSKAEIGFTKAEGAPEPPTEVRLENGHGTSGTELVIKWNKDSVSCDDGNILTFNIFRTSNIDKSFTTVFTNLPGTTDTKIDNTNIVPGVFYTYYIQSVVEKDGVKVKSELSPATAEATGFLLSPPASLDIEDTASDGDVLLKWTPAIGEGSPYNNEYTYRIFYDNSISGNFTNEISGVTYDLGEDGYYKVEVSRKAFYKVVTKNTKTGTESEMSEIVAPNPVAPTNVKASKTSSLGGLDAYKDKVNKNGVYPVQITWSNPKTEIPYGFYVYRSTSPNSSFRNITENAPITQDMMVNGTFTFIDENETARAGTYYYYKVVSINALKKGKNGNNPEEDKELNCAGYGALTPDAWFREYNKTVMRSQAKLSLMHKKTDTDKLGKESINGDLTGTLSYDAHIQGFGAEILMHYTDYADYYINNNESFGRYFIINGDTNTKAEMSADGKMFGIVTVTGMYPAKVDYSTLQIKKGSAGGGGYMVETYDLNNITLIPQTLVHWKVGEEGRQ